MNDYMNGTSGKRLLVAAVVLGLLVWLTGAYHVRAGYVPGSFSTRGGTLSAGTVQGTVTLGPTSPPPCPAPCARPYSTTIRIFNSTKSFTVVSSAVDGTYSIRIPVGTYTVQGTQSGLYPKAPPPVSVTVLRNGVYTVDLRYDSGIR